MHREAPAPSPCKDVDQMVDQPALAQLDLQVTAVDVAGQESQQQSWALGQNARAGAGRREGGKRGRLRVRAEERAEGAARHSRQE